MQNRACALMLPGTLQPSFTIPNATHCPAAFQTDQKAAVPAKGQISSSNEAVPIDSIPEAIVVTADTTPCGLLRLAFSSLSSLRRKEGCIAAQLGVLGSSVDFSTGWTDSKLSVQSPCRAC